ncbi:MAG: hypothetical protein Q8K60_00990, partial [Parachlamydiaceae bacterium]|nr:hypothetical protein [Parachlamydiaceae bacterium]
ERLVVIEKNEDVWIFVADEIDRIYLWDVSQFQTELNENEQTKNVYFKGQMIESGRRINLIDEELLFYRLQKACKGLT